MSVYKFTVFNKLGIVVSGYFYNMCDLSSLPILVNVSIIIYGCLWILLDNVVFLLNNIAANEFGEKA